MKQLILLLPYLTKHWIASAMGALFKKTCKPPQHRGDSGSVALPKSDIMTPTVNKNALFLSQRVSGCIILHDWVYLVHVA